MNNVWIWEGVIKCFTHTRRYGGSWPVVFSPIHEKHSYNSSERVITNAHQPYSCCAISLYYENKKLTWIFNMFNAYFSYIVTIYEMWSNWDLPLMFSLIIWQVGFKVSYMHITPVVGRYVYLSVLNKNTFAHTNRTASATAEVQSHASKINHARNMLNTIKLPWRGVFENDLLTYRSRKFNYLITA